MKQQLYIFIPDDNLTSDLAVSWIIKEAGQEPVYAQGALQDAAAVARDKYVVAVLNGKNILLTHVNLPGSNRQKIIQALPYALEDNLIDDIAGMHICLGEKEQNNNYKVAVVNSEIIKNVTDKLNKAGIETDVLTADFMLLDAAENETVIVLDNENAYLCNDDIACVVQKDIVSQPLLLNKLNTNKLKLVNISGSNNQDFITTLPSQDFDVTAIDFQGNLPSWLVMQHNHKHQINLLQGEFRKKKDWQKHKQKWIPVAALVCIWLAIEGSALIFDYISLTKQNNELQLKINQLYRSTFPNDKRIVNAKVQMEQKLQQLRKRTGNSSQTFSEMLNRSAPILSKTNGLDIKSLRYQAGTIELGVELKNLQMLDTLKSNLQSQLGWKVDVQNAASDKNKVSARLKLSGDKS